MLSYALVDGYTEVPWEVAISRMKSAIADADGVIVDFAFFSREALRLSVELDVAGLTRLQRALEVAGVRLFDRSAAELAKAVAGTPLTKPVVALLHVTFVRGAADAEELRTHPH